MGDDGDGPCKHKMRSGLGWRKPLPLDLLSNSERMAYCLTPGRAACEVAQSREALCTCMHATMLAHVVMPASPVSNHPL